MIPDGLPPFRPAALPPELAGRVPDGLLAWATAAAWTHSPFLRALMRQRGEVLDTVVAHGPAAALAAAHAHALDAALPIAARLRQARGAVALAVALADLSGAWTLEQVTAALSAFADLALDQAIRAAIAERTPAAEPVGFVALALGKLGSHELNYSSDLDPILLFDRATLPRRPREDVDEAGVRIARRVVELMQARDADGYVARIDLRLRPSPEATAIALPVGAARSYYQSDALPWERAAFIRARACAGDIAMGAAFLGDIEPFVWRRSLDFQVLSEVRAISLRIRDHFHDGQQVGPGYDLKRGRGGIREIEFFAQSHQLVFGGRDATLRAPATLDALRVLAAADRIAPETADTLSRAYRYLRAAEHRAQMVADAQTHSVPEQATAREDWAQFAGYADWDGMAHDLTMVTGSVAPIYETATDTPARTAVPQDQSALIRWLGDHGIADDAALASMVAGWLGGNRRALRSPAARAGLEAALPSLLAAFVASADARGAMVRLDRFLEQLPSGAGFLTLLFANPTLAGLLGRLLSAAPALADALARRPELFDALLDRTPHAADPTAELAALIAGARDPEERLTRVRQWTGERRFEIGAGLVEGHTDPLDAAAAYATTADAAITVLGGATEADFTARHGRVPGASLIVLALGRYGGGRLTARSDLDLVYLHSGPEDGVADGPRPVPASLYFHRLASRLTAALSVSTAAGALYEVDTRLRPSGAKGPLVVSLDAFARYQREDAWTFEHMALTRARVVLASAVDRTQVESLIAAVLGAPRDLTILKADVLTMRADMERHRRGGGLLDVKREPGGLIDLEFIVQYLQLAHGRHLTPRFGEALVGFASDGLIGPDLVQAHMLLTRALVTQRLIFDATRGPFPEPPASDAALLARACGHVDVSALRAAILHAKSLVCAEWAAVFNTTRVPG